MLDNVLRNMSIYIDPDALLVGNQASSGRNADFPRIRDGLGDRQNGRV